jgi:hypothetical protein
LQRVPPKERDDFQGKIVSLSNAVPVHMFFVVVVSPIDVDTANTKELQECVENLDALRALGHRKLMRHLEPSCIASSINSMRLSNEVD